MAKHKHFEILRWDVIEDPCTGILSPMAYFVPTTDFIILSKLNNNRIYLNLFDIFKENGEEMYLPNKMKRTLAVIDKSSDIPNCRKNFFDETNTYVIYLKELNWNGYVDLNRKPKFLIDEEIREPESIKQEFTNKNENVKKEILAENFNNNSPIVTDLINNCSPECCENLNSTKSAKLTPLEITLIVITIVFLFLLIFGGLSMLTKSKKMKMESKI